jgi:hypothetical protein
VRSRLQNTRVSESWLYELAIHLGPGEGHLLGPSGATLLALISARVRPRAHNALNLVEVGEVGVVIPRCIDRRTRPATWYRASVKWMP